jgi:hypothetical protein
MFDEQLAEAMMWASLKDRPELIAQADINPNKPASRL